MPIFNFALRPIADLQPVRSAAGPLLEWRDFSDGWFWLVLGGQEILRGDGEPTEGELPYLDERVARLWEGLVQILPAVMAPIPDDLARRLEQPREWRALLERAAALEDEGGRIAASLGFWWERQLESRPLPGAPRVHLWRRGEIIHASWWTPPGDAGWVAVEGHAAIPYAQFLLELHAFDAAFLTLMGERVEALVRAGGHPDARVDLQRLAAEQAERAAWLDAALAQKPAAQDWAEPRWLVQQLLPQ